MLLINPRRRLGCKISSPARIAQLLSRRASLRTFRWLASHVAPLLVLCCFLGAASQPSRAQTNGALLEIKGTVTQQVGDSTLVQNIDLFVNDGAIHSGSSQTAPCDTTSTDAFVLQAGSPHGCDPLDSFESSISDGHFSFIQGGSALLPQYRFDIVTHYQCVFNGDSCNSAMTNTNDTITSADSGFLTVTNSGSSTFNGTITLSGTSRFCPFEEGGNESDSISGPFTTDHSVTLALDPDSSTCGGYTGTITAPEGAQPVTPGGTVTFTLGPVNQSISFPAGTTSLPGEEILDSVMFVDDGPAFTGDPPALPPGLNATFDGAQANTFSGGSNVPAGSTCVHVAGTDANGHGSCAVIMNNCYQGGIKLTDCKNIDPHGNLILLNSDFPTADSLTHPAYVIRSDSDLAHCTPPHLLYPTGCDDWANITGRGNTTQTPGCTKPPCHGGGGTGGLNGEETLADLNLSVNGQDCNILTFAFSVPAVRPEDDVQVNGDLKSCQNLAAFGEKTFNFFGTTLLVGNVNLYLEAPKQPSCSSTQLQLLTPHPLPLFLPFGSNVPFRFRFEMPASVCHGTTATIWSVVTSGDITDVFGAPLPVQ